MPRPAYTPKSYPQSITQVENSESDSQLTRSFERVVGVEGRQLERQPGAERPRCGLDRGEQQAGIRPGPLHDLGRRWPELTDDRRGVDGADFVLDDAGRIHGAVAEIGEDRRQVVDDGAELVGGAARDRVLDGFARAGVPAERIR